jgi:hypothetical protein
MLSERDYPNTKERITVHMQYKEFSVSFLLETKSFFVIELLNLVGCVEKRTAIFVT